MKVDFTNLVPVTEEARSAEQRAQEELSKRIRQRKFEKAAAELEDQSEGIQENLKRMVECLGLIVMLLYSSSTTELTLILFSSHLSDIGYLL